MIGAASDDYVRHTKADVIAPSSTSSGSSASDEIVMVGDRRFDVEGAAAHGIDTIGVTWGYGSRRRAASGRRLGDRRAPATIVVGIDRLALSTVDASRDTTHGSQR